MDSRNEGEGQEFLPRPHGAAMLGLQRNGFTRMNWRRGALRAALSIASIAILVIYSRRPGNDFQVYVDSGKALLQGQDIYLAPLPSINTGPPFFSVLCMLPALLDRLSETLARAIWMILNTGALLWILAMASDLIHKRRLPVISPPLLVPLLCTLPYILYHLLYHQVNLIVFAITLAGMKLQEEKREGLGGALVGVGAALKVMPILFVPYLIYRGRWRAACSALAVAALLTFSPVVLLGWNLYRQDLKYWLTMVSNNPIWDAGCRNQSVLAMWERFVGHGCIPLVTPGTLVLEMSRAPGVRIAWMATVAVTGLAMLCSFRGRPERGSSAVLLEWSVVFSVSAIFGPVGWKHYMVVLLLPNAILYAFWRTHPDPRTRRIAGIFLGVCLALCLASTRGLWPNAWCLRALMASNLTVATLTMIGGLLWLRAREGAAARPGPDPAAAAIPN